MLITIDFLMVKLIHFKMARYIDGQAAFLFAMTETHPMRIIYFSLAMV